MQDLNPYPKREAENLIRKTVAILDRYGKLYEQLSEGRFKDYDAHPGL
jgi:hypothetical protein